MSRSIVAEALWRVPRWAGGRRWPHGIDDRSVAAHTGAQAAPDGTA
jgi:hypothetical protein